MIQLAIIGGGIGGIATALALQARGCSVQVYEQSATLREAGAGVGLSPNGLLPLYRMGLRTILEKVGVAYTSEILTWTGDIVSREDPLDQSSLDQNAVRPMTFHRRELLEALASALPADTVAYDHKCTGVEPVDEHVCIHFEDRESVTVDAVIGADGIHSIVQRAIVPPSPPVSEGIMAYRGLIPMERLSWVDGMWSSMWMGPDRSFLTYPVASGSMMNIVGFVPSKIDVGESWVALGKVSDLAREYDGWTDAVVKTIAAMDETYCWGIFDRAPLAQWSNGRIAVLGDAAHPMVPHFGQGANQAIEDAFTLGVLLESAAPADLPESFAAYERIRKERTSRVQAGAREAGRLYRNAELDLDTRKNSMEKILTEFSQWVFPHDAEAVAAEFQHNCPVTQ